MQLQKQVCWLESDVTFLITDYILSQCKLKVLMQTKLSSDEHFDVYYL